MHILFLIGETVGYRIQLDSCITPGYTKIKFLTDSALLKELMRDPLLSCYSIVMIDDAHDRSIYTEIILSLLRKIIKLRKDLKIVIASSTLDVDTFQNFFIHSSSGLHRKQQSVVVYPIKGRVCNVDISYVKWPVLNYINATAEIILDIHVTQSPGDIIAFLTDEFEIRSVTEFIKNDERFSSEGKLCMTILPMYASLPPMEQLKVFKPVSSIGAPNNSRKVVLSTNIAETSITIPGIVYVIDCGFVKMTIYDAMSDTEFLAVVPISKESANQRAGRAGRIRSGKVFRLYTKKAFNSFEDKSLPEIHRINLSPLLLSLKALGVDNLLRFHYLTRPPAINLARGIEQLFALGAIDSEGRLLRPLGLRMAEIQLHPMLSKILLASSEYGCSVEICTIISLLMVRNIFLRPTNKTFEALRMQNKFQVDGGDLLTLLNAYLGFCEERQSLDWCKENYLNGKALKYAVKIRETFVQILEIYNLPLKSANGDDKLVRKAIFSGMFPNLAKLTLDGNYESVRNKEAHFSIHPGSVLSRQVKKPTWVVYYGVSEGTRGYINRLTPVEFDWIKEIASEFYEYGTEREVSEKRLKLDNNDS